MISAIIVGSIAFVVYLLFQATGIYAGDAGDLVTAAFEGGIPHPPGYPLYTLMGWMLSQIPISSVAWRLTLLSNIPHAFVVGLVYWLVLCLTKRVVPAVFSSLLLAGNYLFFLYSVTPEVFALFDAFVVAVIVLTYRLLRRPSEQGAIALLFLLGLSLAHHHVIVFLSPGLFYVFGRTFRRLRINPQSAFRLAGAFLAGLAPYAYLAAAAPRTAIIMWDKPTTLSRLVSLILRADYGTFVSSGAAAVEWYPRLLNVRAYGEFLLLDFTWVGILLAAVGARRLAQTNKPFLTFLLLSILGVGPLFFFYASFPLQGAFALGTYERFLLPSYVIVAILAGVGLSHSAEIVGNILRASRLRSFAKSAPVTFSMLVAMSLAAMSLWRFWGLSGDRTAQSLGVDILASSPSRAIIFLVHDTALFTTQYVRYVERIRSDTAVLHFARIVRPDYQETVRIRFPDIIIPPASERFFEELVQANAMGRPIASNIEFPLPEGYVWVPNGLLFLATPEGQARELEEIQGKNDQLWGGYQDPKRGILARYRHLMLSHVLDEYATGRIAYGKFLFRADRVNEAEVQFQAAVDLGADSTLAEAWTYLGITQVLEAKCDAALSSFASARGLRPEDSRLYYYEAVTYRECLKDEAKALERFRLYEQARKESEQPLESL